MNEVEDIVISDELVNVLIRTVDKMNSQLDELIEKLSECSD